MADGTCWNQLTPAVIEQIISRLPPNEVACTVRLVNKALWLQFRDKRIAVLSQPSPHHAFSWRWSSLGGGAAPLLSMSLAQRRELLCLTAQSGSLANLQVAAAAVGCPLTNEVLDAAAAAGHLHICDWITSPAAASFTATGVACRYSSRTVSAAAAAGHQDVTLVALHHDPDWADIDSMTTEAWIAASGSGQRGVCETLLEHHANNASIPAEAVYAALRGGHIDLAEWLLGLQGLGPVDEEGLLEAAAHGLDLPALQRFFRLRGIITGVSSGGDVRLLWRELQREPELVKSALSGRTPDWSSKVEWLEAKGCVLSTENSDRDDEFLKEIGEVTDGVERLRQWQERSPMDSVDWGICLEAACETANLPVLPYVVEHLHAEHWDEYAEESVEQYLEDAIRGAISNGDIPCLRALVALGLRIQPSEVCWKAQHPETLSWIGGPEAAGAGGAEALAEALADPCFAAEVAESGNLELLQWLRGRGCVWNEAAFVAAAKAGYPAMLEWMAGAGCPMGAGGAPYREADRNRDMATLQCLQRLGCP